MRFTLPDTEWRKRLSPEQFDVLRGGGTESACSSWLAEEERTGAFHCAGCGHPAFHSDGKYDSATGWPSFHSPLPAGVFEDPATTKRFPAINLTQTEVTCPRCRSHLGHVFDDGPDPTGHRYCINGVALTFVPDSASPSIDAAVKQ